MGSFKNEVFESQRQKVGTLPFPYGLQVLESKLPTQMQGALKTLHF